MNNLIGEDIKLMRKRYDEALQLRGIPCRYQYPILPGTNNQGESEIDSYSPCEDTFIFFDGSPKIKTFKRYGWVIENDEELPFLIHCSFNLAKVQRDSVFRIAGQYTELPERTFKVTEISYDMQAPDHLVCQVIPVYEDQIVGRTKREVSQTFNKSEHFIKQKIDYRGNVNEKSSRYRRTGKPKSISASILLQNGEDNNMLKVTGADIQLTRGDTGYFDITIKNPNGSKYVREEGDSLVFTVKPSISSTTSVLTKLIPNLTLELDPSDTKGLDFKTYKYDIQLTTKTGEVFTVIGPANFTVLSEVTD